MAQNYRICAVLYQPPSEQKIREEGRSFFPYSMIQIDVYTSSVSVNWTVTGEPWMQPQDFQRP